MDNYNGWYLEPRTFRDKGLRCTTTDREREEGCGAGDWVVNMKNGLVTATPNSHNYDMVLVH